jgi:hypothetical protein
LDLVKGIGNTVRLYYDDNAVVPQPYTDPGEYGFNTKGTGDNPNSYLVTDQVTLAGNYNFGTALGAGSNWFFTGLDPSVAVKNGGTLTIPPRLTGTLLTANGLSVETEGKVEVGGTLVVTTGGAGVFLVDGQIAVSGSTATLSNTAAAAFGAVLGANGTGSIVVSNGARYMLNSIETYGPAAPVTTGIIRTAADTELTLSNLKTSVKGASPVVIRSDIVVGANTTFEATAPLTFDAGKAIQVAPAGTYVNKEGSYGPLGNLIKTDGTSTTINVAATGITIGTSGAATVYNLTVYANQPLILDSNAGVTFVREGNITIEPGAVLDIEGTGVHTYGKNGTDIETDATATLVVTPTGYTVTGGKATIKLNPLNVTGTFTVGTGGSLAWGAAANISLKPGASYVTPSGSYGPTSAASLVQTAANTTMTVSTTGIMFSGVSLPINIKGAVPTGEAWDVTAVPAITTQNVVVSGGAKYTDAVGSYGKGGDQIDSASATDSGTITIIPGGSYIVGGGPVSIEAALTIENDQTFTVQSGGVVNFGAGSIQVAGTGVYTRLDGTISKADTATLIKLGDDNTITFASTGITLGGTNDMMLVGTLPVYGILAGGTVPLKGATNTATLNVALGTTVTGTNLLALFTGPLSWPTAQAEIWKWTSTTYVKQ